AQEIVVRGDAGALIESIPFTPITAPKNKSWELRCFLTIEKCEVCVVGAGGVPAETFQLLSHTQRLRQIWGSRPALTDIRHRRTHCRRHEPTSRSLPRLDGCAEFRFARR